MIGPKSVAAFQVWPGLIRGSFIVNSSIRASAIGRCTITREPATQPWPEFARIEPAMQVAAFSRSASAKTSCGLLPPSSSVTGLMPLSAAAFMIAVPVRVDPVKEILPIPGWRASASPVTPVPWTTLKMPAGMPASIAS